MLGYSLNIWNFIANIATAIVSGLPREKVEIRPTSKTILQKPNESFKPTSEKHYHRPTAKPVVEKQTLLKEEKKVKGAR